MKNTFKHGGLVRFGHFDANPASTENGAIYYNNTANLFKVYENGSWENLATRKYADSIAAGFDPKESVVAASSANVALSGLDPLTIDDVVLQSNDRVLLKNQSDAIQNGVYLYSTTEGNYTLTRSADFNDSVEVNGGEFIFVAGGTTWATTAWIVTGVGTIGVDSLTFSQVQGQAKSLNQAYAVGNVITTSSLSGAVIIAGDQKLSVTAAGGIDVGLGSLTVDSSGDLTRIRSIPYHFPTAQASFSNAALVNDSSGSLSWSRLTIDGLSDVALTDGTVSAGDLLRFNGTAWVNEVALSSSDGASGKIIMTDASGFLDSSFLTVTLQDVYKQTTDGSNAVIITDSSDGSIVIAGDQSLIVSAAEGIKLAQDGDPTKYVQMKYKDSILLPGGSESLISDLGFSTSVHNGLWASYKIRDQGTGAVRVGHLLLGTDGSDVSVADSFAETATLDITWSASVVSGEVEVTCLAGSGDKIMNAKLELLS